jgi:hypothetical protein
VRARDDASARGIRNCLPRAYNWVAVVGLSWSVGGWPLVWGAKGSAELLGCYMLSGVLGCIRFIAWAWR